MSMRKSTEHPEELDFEISATLSTTELEIRELAKQLYAWNWIDTTGGSFSIRLPQKKDLFALTPTHTGFRRWEVNSGLVVLTHELELSHHSTSQFRAHPSAIVHAKVYEVLPNAGAVIHTHSPFSLTFACAGKDIEPYTLHSQILGNVPCLASNADDVKNRSTEFIHETEQRMTSGMVGYKYAFEHFEQFLVHMKEHLLCRHDELRRHGLAFTVYKHGIFVVARSLSEAFDNLIRVERNAQVQLLTLNLPRAETRSQP